MIEIHILDCGTTVVDEALPFSDRSGNPIAFTGLFRGRQHKLEVPVTAYLIECPKGTVLVDTGWDTAIRTNPRKYEGIINYFASPGRLPEGKAVTEHLARLSHRPDDIDYCILTHLDIDHAGGIGLVRNAKHILASASEIKAANGRHPRYRKRLWQGISMASFPDREIDLFGDGTISLIPMPGHSAGMTAVKVSNGRSFVIIAGDCGYGRASWERLVLPGIVWDKEQALSSLKRLREYALDENCKAVLMTHDPEHASGIIKL